MLSVISVGFCRVFLCRMSEVNPCADIVFCVSIESRTEAFNNPG